MRIEEWPSEAQAGVRRLRASHRPSLPPDFARSMSAPGRMLAKQRWLWLQVAFAAAFVWFFGRTITMEWGELATVRASIHPNWLGIGKSSLLVLASYGVLIETWRRTVVAWGEHLPRGAASRIWLVSNLGKYVPGKIWQIAAMGALAQREGVPAIAAIGSSLVVNLINVLAGFMVVALAGSARLAGPVLLPGIALFLVLLVFTPWLVPRGARLAQRLTGRVISEARVPPAAIVAAVIGCSVAWTLYGLAFRELAEAVFGVRSGSHANYMAVFTLSYLVGYLAFFAPGGLGARELSLVALLPAAGLEAGAQATLLVLISRLWLTVLETVPGLIFLALRRHDTPKTLFSTNGSQTEDSRGG